ncbi:hypothetical protein J6590_062680 [Homalodisca vitripennis]|nr:hypothetical protein J6590_062680 [Homalodisca vitripennis]
MTQRYFTSRLMSSISKSINNRSVELSVPHIQPHNPGNDPTVSHIASHVKSINNRSVELSVPHIQRYNPGTDPTVSHVRHLSSISKSINKRSVEKVVPQIQRHNPGTDPTSCPCPTYSVITLALTQRCIKSRRMSLISKSSNTRSVELAVPHIQRTTLALTQRYLTSRRMSMSTHGSGRSDSRASVGTNSHEELKSLKSLSHQPQLCSTKPGPERQLRNTFGWARVDVICSTKPGPERQLRNTFGWARVDVIVMLIGCVFLASLCFSVLVEALQTLVHISHHDEMHAPIPVLIVGILAMVLNLLAYLLIGGYTFHQSSFLINGNETATKSFTEEEIKKQAVAKKTEKRQGMWGLSRDCVGCVVVIICAIVVHNSSSDVAKYVDPLFSIISATLVLLLSYPFSNLVDDLQYLNRIIQETPMPSKDNSNDECIVEMKY